MSQLNQILLITEIVLFPHCTDDSNCQAKAAVIMSTAVQDKISSEVRQNLQYYKLKNSCLA